IPVPVDQRRHPKVQLLLDIQVPVLVPCRHLLSQNLLCQIMRPMYTKALLRPSSLQRIFQTPFASLWIDVLAISFQSIDSIACCSTKRSSAFKSNRSDRPTFTEGSSRNRAFL